MRHLYAVVAMDEPLDMPWETFFGGEPEASKKGQRMNRERSLESERSGLRPDRDRCRHQRCRNRSRRRHARAEGVDARQGRHLQRHDAVGDAPHTRGLRYLEPYEFPLVRESLADREKLLQIAPHLVKPLRFVVPIYERSAGDRA